jgi:hypothetical protein
VIQRRSSRHIRVRGSSRSAGRRLDVPPSRNAGGWVYFGEKRIRHSLFAFSIDAADLNERIDLGISPGVQRSEIVPVGQVFHHAGSPYTLK